MNSPAPELYDPMIYDIMRENANRLGGRYIALERAAATPEEAAKWGQLDAALVLEVRAIDTLDEDAVRSASAEFVRRFQELERPQSAAS